MSIDDNRTPSPPHRKPLWPWLLLLILTLCAIYSYNRVTEIAEDMRKNLPDAAIEFFYDLLNSDRQNHDGIRVDVSPTPFIYR